MSRFSFVFLAGIVIFLISKSAFAGPDVTDDVVKEFVRFFRAAQMGQLVGIWKQQNHAECQSLDKAGDSWHYYCQVSGKYWNATYFFYPAPAKQAFTLQRMEIKRVEIHSYKYYPDVSQQIRKDMARDIQEKFSLLRSLEAKLAPFLGNATPAKREKREFWDYDLWDSKLAFLWEKPNDYSLLSFTQETNPKSTGSKVSFKRETNPLLLLDKSRDKGEFPYDWKWREQRRNHLAYLACLQAGLHGCGTAIQQVKKGRGKIPGYAFKEAIEKFNKIDRNSREYPPLLFWIDRLIGDSHYEPPSNPGKLWESGIIPMSDHYAGNVYRANLLEELALHHQDSFWGRRAFMEMIDSDWNETRTCGGGFGPVFYIVVRVGEKFLKRHPHCESSREVVLALARAYESWWVLSHETKPIIGDNPERYQKGSAAARLSAIRYYTVYLRDQRSLGKPEKVWLEEVLFLLKKNLNTHETYFYEPLVCE